MRRVLIFVILVILLALPVRAMEFEAPPPPESAAELLPKEADSFGEGLWNVLTEAVKLAGEDDLYVAGGYHLFKEALPLADRLYLTEVDLVVEDGDTFFPEFDEGAYTVTPGETGGEEVTFQRMTYIRKE